MIQQKVAARSKAKREITKRDRNRRDDTRNW